MSITSGGNARATATVTASGAASGDREIATSLTPEQEAQLRSIGMGDEDIAAVSALLAEGKFTNTMLDGIISRALEAKDHPWGLTNSNVQVLGGLAGASALLTGTLPGRGATALTRLSHIGAAAAAGGVVLGAAVLGERAAQALQDGGMSSEAASAVVLGSGAVLGTGLSFAAHGLTKGVVPKAGAGPGGIAALGSGRFLGASMLDGLGSFAVPIAGTAAAWFALDALSNKLGDSAAGNALAAGIGAGGLLGGIKLAAASKGVAGAAASSLRRLGAGLAIGGGLIAAAKGGEALGKALGIQERNRLVEFGGLAAAATGALIAARGVGKTHDPRLKVLGLGVAALGALVMVAGGGFPRPSEVDQRPTRLHVAGVRGRDAPGIAG